MSEPSKAAMLASIAEGAGTEETTSAVRALTVRLPIHTYAAVHALAKLSNGTKGAMVASLVDSAIEEVTSKLSPARRHLFLHLQGEALQQLVIECEQESTKMGHQS
jgi:hypothetical protein